MLTLLQLVLFWMIFDSIYLVYRIILLVFHKKKLRYHVHPFVSVLIPAYNEELTIEKTLKSCLHQTYPKMEVIVINDGSTDDTAKVVERFKKDNSKNLKSKNIKFTLINQKNQGKAKALNNGKDKAKGEFLVTIDADSFLNSHAIEKSMGYFISEDIGAVAGNVVALPRKSLLGYLQKLEYELGIFYIRASQSSLGNVTVTPGAFSVYRKKALKKFEEGTLTEDFDTSIKILERDCKIVMAPDAICYTQIPLTVSDLIKQRIRWQQGGLQVFAKHLFHPKRISVTLEWTFLFLFGFYSLFSKVLALFTIPLFFAGGDLTSLFLIMVSFFVYSIISYGIPFLIVSHYSHDKKAILYMPLFILYYHTIILYSVLAAQIIELKGGEKIWGRIKRYHI